MGRERGVKSQPWHRLVKSWLLPAVDGNVSRLPKFTCQSLHPSVTVLGDKAFKERTKVK